MESKPSMQHQILCHFKSLYRTNHSTSQPWHTIFVICYSLVSVFAFLCNLLLLITLYSHNKKRPAIRQNVYSQSRRRRRRLSRRRRTRSILVLATKPKLAEITRDHLIAYLATFDLLLSVTMPFTAFDVLSKYWPLGPNTEVLCRFARSVPSAIVYSSSMIIITIACNCYRQILYSSKRQLTPTTIRYLLAVIVIISILISIPIFYYTKLNHLFKGASDELSVYSSEEDESEYVEYDSSDLEMYNWTSSLSPNISSSEYFEYASSDVEMYHWTSSVSANSSTTDKPKLVTSSTNNNTEISCSDSKEVNLSSITMCIDEWPIAHDGTRSRVYYSIFSLLVQLILPFVIISIAYLKVYQRLARQSKIQTRVCRTQERIRKENRRNKRRNKLLLTISLFFLIAWTPLGLFGTVSDANINIFGDNVETTTMIFMIFHLIGMSSACVNPIIYGYRHKHVRAGNDAR